MEGYISDIITTLYSYINEENTPYLTREEIKNKKTLVTNCGVNAEFLFSLLKKHDVSEKDLIFHNNLKGFKFNKSYVYKIYNVWKEGHSHVAVFYFNGDEWVFVESTENMNGLKFRKFSKLSLSEFLLDRQRISIWQEICFLPIRTDKVNIVINKAKWINDNVKLI